MIAGILLAAGASRRFGTPKLLQLLEGKQVVRWSAEALAGSPVEELVVVTGTHDAEIRRALDGMSVRFAINPQPELGMGRSIGCGIAAIDAKMEAALIALADQPRPSVGALRAVIERFEAGGASIVAPMFRGEPGHPVLFARAVFDELRQLEGDRGARSVVERNPARVSFVELDEIPPADVDVRGDLDRFGPIR